MTHDRLAIVNGFGISLGDSLIGLQALRAAQEVAGFPRPVLVRKPFGREMVAQIYRHCSDFADVDTTGALGERFGRVIDISDFAFDPGFRGVAMIDFFLDRLGLAPASVPQPLKRNAWLASRVTPVPPDDLPPRYVLVCPGSSMALRDMPEPTHRLILETLRRTQALPVVTQGSAANGAATVPPRADFAALCGLVAGAACLISTDTAMIHLADAFDVPCLAFFTTHRPEWRVRDYPLCEGVYLPALGLPDALEFSRGDDDLAAVAQAWAAGLPDLAARVETFAHAHQ